MNNLIKKRSTLIFIAMLIFYFLGFWYCANQAIFNAWQSAFPKNSEILDTLNFRFWFFTGGGILFLCAFITHIVIKIKKANKNYRNLHKEP
jgi:hypothetical protein